MLKIVLISNYLFIMTPRQVEKIEKQIAAIRKVLADKKRKWGGYHDGRGLRYAPPQYYIKLNDFKGSMTYYRWFSKNFPDDMGALVFLFEWCMTLFKNAKLKEAEKKALQTFMANTYLIDKFLGNPFHSFDKLQSSEWQKEQVNQYLPYRADQGNLNDFAYWLSQFVLTAKYQETTQTFIAIEVQLLTEPRGSKRSELVEKESRLLDNY